MRASSRPAERWLGLAAAVLLLAGCSGPTPDHGFEINSADLRWRDGLLYLDLEQTLQLSDEARNALQHGVSLTVQLDLELLESKGGRILDSRRHYEIRYLPMSDRYQLLRSDGRPSRAYPRLRHVLAELSALRWQVETGPLAEGAYELRLRAHLDRDRMPPPMRLPIVFSADWLHDSRWTSWPLRVAPS